MRPETVKENKKGFIRKIILITKYNTIIELKSKTTPRRNWAPLSKDLSAKGKRGIKKSQACDRLEFIAQAQRGWGCLDFYSFNRIS